MHITYLVPFAKYWKVETRSWTKVRFDRSNPLALIYNYYYLAAQYERLDYDEEGAGYLTRMTR